MNYDAVLSYHLNPLTCGVAKFNQRLAKELGVTCHSLSPNSTSCAPLVSIKASEIGPHWAGLLPDRACTLLLHDRPVQLPTTSRARVLYADELGCPSTLSGDKSVGPLDVLCFGMAHKFQTTHFLRLRHLIERLTSDYTISLSTAVHEGSPWDAALTENAALMRQVFGTHLRVMGFLADDGLARLLSTVHACALFFDPAARANNTTLWAALDAAVPTFTNLDADSPPELVHGQNVFNLAQLTEWPDAAQRRVARFGGRTLTQGRYGWARLLEQLA